MAKLIIQGLSGAGYFAEASFLQRIGEYNFLFASGWLLALSVLVVVAVSLMTKAPDAARVATLTYATTTEEQRRESRESWNHWDIILTAVVLGLVAVLYLYFSFWLR